MPKKKKVKESTATEFKFDYRYTPKPYFTAPSPAASPLSSQTSLNRSSLSNGSSKPSPQTQKPLPTRQSSNFNADTWQNQRQNGYGYNRGSNYARATTQSNTGSKTSTKQPTIESTEEVTKSDPTTSLKDQANMRKMFEEMFRGRVESKVIDMVLLDANWNVNQALDILSQLATEDNSHLRIPTTTSELATIGYGTQTPDHNLTPTAPTLSYTSSVTSLDEYGIEFTRDVTQRNLHEVADVLRNGPDDINDLDRQKLARSRAATPRTIPRNGNMTLKNISLGSTESLESNRSHYGHEPSGTSYLTATLTREGTPKKSNFEKTMSLHDISSADDGGLTLSIARDQYQPDLGTARSDPGRIESLLIPLDHHGDIVLEKGTYDHLLNAQADQPENTEQGAAAGPLSHSASISDYSQAISSLTSHLRTEDEIQSSLSNDSSEAAVNGISSQSGRAGQDVPLISFSPDSEAAASPSDNDPPPSLYTLGGQSIPKSEGGKLSHRDSNATSGATSAGGPVTTSPGSDKENQYPYNGILGSGTAVPTAFESARPKERSARSAAVPDESTVRLLEAAGSAEKVMFIMRGMPGSGKSYLGRQLIENTPGCMFSGDDYFINSRGEYRWDSSQLTDAHTWNHNRVREAVETGVSPVVVDNTHTQSWEMEGYVKMALLNGYRPILAEPTTPWRYKAKELAKRNVHSVPYTTIKHMVERFVHSITIEQIVDTITRRDSSLAPMAEQFHKSSSGHKLSRKKPASKTIKRNKQHSDVEKLKDKKVDELTLELEQLLLKQQTPKQHRKQVSEEDNRAETEIMYPNPASADGLRRKATIKVLNCEKPQANAVDSPASKSSDRAKAKHRGSSKSESQSSKRVSQSEAVPSPDKSASTHDQNTPKHDQNTPKHDQREAAQSLPTSLVIDQSPATSTEEVKLRPISAVRSSTTSGIAQSLSSESTLTGKPDQSNTTSRPTNLSNTTSPPTSQSAANVVETSQSEERTVVSGSSTLPRSSSRASDGGAGHMSHSASLPRPKDKSKSKKSSTKKSTSTSLLQVDPQVKDRWLSNDWAIPPYPLAAAVSDIVDPPPPYAEHDEGTEASPPVQPNPLVKTRDAETLTEPGDYAMAYKAMLHNSQLPPGWLLLSRKSKEPFSPPADAIPYKSSVVTHDKGTVINEGDIPLSESSSTDELSTSHTERQLHRLHSCFPQLSKKQLAEFLELCGGDETWATNLLLDSNKVPISKAKRSLTRVLSLPDNKRFRSKNKVSKLAIMRRFSKAIVPVTSCLGRADHPAYSQLSQDTVDLSLTPGQVLSLHALFGSPDTEIPGLGDEASRSVSVPGWIAHRIYKCMVSSLAWEESSAAGEGDSTTLLASPPQRPPRRRRTIPANLHTAHESSYTIDTLSRIASELTSPPASDATSPPASQSVEEAADWSIEAALDQPDSKADEELARRLQAEDLLNAPSSGGTDRLSLIADEQFARSLAAQDAAEKQPDMSSRVKRNRLAEMYPGVDSVFLDEVYKTHGYNLERTVAYLTDHLEQGPVESSAAGGAAGNTGWESASVRAAVSPSKDSTVTSAALKADEDQWFDVEEYEATADYAEYRTEAMIHKGLSKELSDKAAAAKSSGKYDVSTHYAQKAQQQWQMYQKANLEAAVKIFKQKNTNRNSDEIDLHGLHPDEAAMVVGELLKHKLREGKSKYLHIITGRGNRSKGGVARVRQQVEGFLHKNHYSYSMVNPGMIRVVLG